MEGEKYIRKGVAEPLRKGEASSQNLEHTFIKRDSINQGKRKRYCDNPLQRTRRKP